MAYKLLARNLPVPPSLQSAVFTPTEALKLVASQERANLANLAASSSSSPLALNGISAHKQQPPTPVENGSSRPTSAVEQVQEAEKEEAPLEQVEDPTSLVYPYNSFVHPLDLASNHLGRRPLVIPTLLPLGLSSQTIADERNRFISARVQQRLSELEKLPSNLAQSDYRPLGKTLDEDEGVENVTPTITSLKIKALIELKSLNLLSRQRALREEVIRGYNQASALSLPADRSAFRRSKKQALRDARATETLEKKQRTDREQRAKQKHLDHLSEIANHGRDLTAAHRAHQAKFGKIGKALLKFHVDAEKDEQRRVERVSKERLKALRADDEEGYLKLIDTAKDTRITHLLRQTDAFLESLANAVVAQQQDAVMEENGGVDPNQMAVDEQVAAVDESRFGAAPVFEEEAAKDKVDYYNVAHRIKETVTKQPTILVGGELKSYQIKGLEWMVSLYNNHVNGILADEMVSFFHAITIFLQCCPFSCN